MTKPTYSLSIIIVLFASVALMVGCDKEKSEAPAPASATTSTTGSKSPTAPGPAAPDNAASTLVPVTTSSFDQEVLTSERPVLAVFSASWCGHCKELRGRLGEVAGASTVKIATIDIDTNADLQARHGVTGVPAAVVFMAGAEVGRFVGVRSAEKLGTLLSALGRPDASRESLAEMLRELAAEDDGTAGCALGADGEPGDGAVCAPPDSM